MTTIRSTQTTPSATTVEQPAANVEVDNVEVAAPVEAAREPALVEDVFAVAAGKLLQELGEPQLPVSELAGAKPSPTHVMELITQELFKAESAIAVVDISNQLKENPNDSLVLSVLALPGLREQLATALGQMDMQGTALQAEMLERLPAEAVLALSDFRDQSFAMLGSLTNGGDLLDASSSVPQEQFSEASGWFQRARGMAEAFSAGKPVLSSLDHAVVTNQAQEGGGMLLKTLLDRAQQPGVPIDRLKALTSFGLLVEGSLEYLIGTAGAIFAKDSNAHMKVLGQSLQYLKEQKLGILKQLQSKEAKAMGLSMLMAQSNQKIERKIDLLTMLSFLAACFAIALAVVAIVLAVCLAISTCGAGTGVSALMIVCCVGVIAASVGTLVVTIVMNIGPLLKGAAVILKHLGLKDLSDQVADWDKQWEDNVASKPWFKVACICALLGFAIVGGVCSFGLAAAPMVVNLMSTCVSIGAGLFTIGMAVATYAVTADLIRESLKLASLHADLARLEVRMAEILLEMKRLQLREDGEQQRAKSHEAQKEAIMDHLQAAASSLADMRKSVSML